MEIKIECPRCQTFMTLSADKANQYASCTNCGGKVWVPKQAARSGGAAAPQAAPAVPVAAQAGSAPVAAPGKVSQPAAQPRPVAGGTAAQAPTKRPLPAGKAAPTARRKAPSVPPGTAAIPPGAPPAGPISRGAPPVGQDAASRQKPRVAKFITADVAKSSLLPASDGKLPELHLEHGEENKRTPREKSGGSPWLLAVAVCVSLSLSVFVLLVPGPEAPRQDDAVESARQRVTAYYGDSDGTLEPYQMYLRQAQLARSRGDVAAERENYRRVLTMLRDESLDDQRGLTGFRRGDERAADFKSDEDLQRQISTILRSLR